MNKLLFQHIENLKSAIMTLPATREKGFEGLIGAALSEITKVPFRLAGSGSQFGLDGKPAYEGDAICFEAKLYEKEVPREKVLYKIAEFSIRDTETDIWVLGATSMIRNQLVDDTRKLGNRSGIDVLILDWSETDLPPLAVALTMGRRSVKEFLESNIHDDETLRKAIDSLKAVKNSQDFAPHADRIQAHLSEPTVGWALAQKANTNWLNDVFSSRKKARTKFGQPLSPGDTDTKNVRQRKALIKKLHACLVNTLCETLVCILGGEGHGKSWIVAQSWLALMHKPLMVFLSPDDFTETARQEDAIDIIISNLIRQTGDSINSTTQERCKRRLKQRRRHPSTDSPGLIVVIDGINQRPNFDWGFIIEGIVDELNQLGGRLIITARTEYFQDRVKRRLSLSFTEITVPEWTESERNEILATHGIKASDLHSAVASSLRNPRLLGIAFELLDKADITNFEELTVSRLLFEHMRISEREAPVPQPAQSFARRLQKHAQAILYRMNAKQIDDLNIFEEDMGAVADGRFYQVVDGDPTRYCLKDDGLTLALGFAMIDRLRIAKRNSRDLDAEIEVLLEPISALDDTANVIIAALTVTVADERYEQDIAASLAKGFSQLQNPDQTQFVAFVGLVKSRPQGFIDAAYALSLAGGHQPNFDWIQGALIAATSDKSVWQEIAGKVHYWLSVHTLSPERGTFRHPSRDPQDKVQEELEKNRKKIDEKLQSFSASERSILEYLPKEEGNLSRLSRLALLLLAGKPLAPFAKSLVNWSFSYALNSDHTAPYKDFIHLVSLNRIDWLQTRMALLDASVSLREAVVSSTGKWTLVNILRATGHSNDDKEAKSLVKELTKDNPIFESWRLIENYCATDPCDPTSEEPENVTGTAEQYEAIDVGKLRQNMGQTSDDHFFIKARPAIVRFKPEVAVQKHKKFASDVLKRSGFPLRQGLFELHRHNALLTIKEAHELVKKLHDAKVAGTAFGLSEQDAWIVSQYHLLQAFPFLSAQEQTEILLSDETNGDILLDLMESAKPLGEEEFEALIGSACEEDNERKQYLLLVLAKYTSVQLSTEARTYIATLFRSKSERVRAIALGIIAQSSDNELLSQVAESGWKASDIKTEDGFEFWFGSMALLEAAARGFIAHNEVLDRISTQLYGRAAAMLNLDAARNIAQRIDMSIKQATGLSGNLLAPDIELQVHPSTPLEPCRFKVSERPSKTHDILEEMQRLSERSEDFDQRQRRNYDAFIEFKANLTQEKARIVLDCIGLEEFASVVSASEELADHWHELFLDISDTKLPAVHNLVLLLAHALGEKDPTKAEDLFRRVKDSNPLVRFTFGEAGVHLDMVATWANDCSPALNELCFERLDRAKTDHCLSLEVLAALMSGRQELLRTYIEAKLDKEEPAEISRGIMVVGFSDKSEYNDEILKRYESTAGLIGSALKAARYAYERNIWARHWFDKMCQTDKNVEFWRYAVLFSKIVDGRFAVWNSDYTQENKSIQLFGPSVKRDLKNRYARWESHRNKKLYGLEVPASIFLTGTNVND